MHKIIGFACIIGEIVDIYITYEYKCLYIHILWDECCNTDDKFHTMITIINTDSHLDEGVFKLIIWKLPLYINDISVSWCLYFIYIKSHWK